MTQYNALNAKLSNSKRNKLKSGKKIVLSDFKFFMEYHWRF